MKLVIMSLLATLCLFLFASESSAYVYIDEDFEGNAAFIDRDWPVRNIDEYPTTASITVKGMNLRNILDWEDHVTPKPIFQNTGSIVSSRYFLGTHSLKLGTDQSVKVMPIKYIGSNIVDFRLFQFAVSFTTATAQLKAGRRIGFYQSDWSTITSNTKAGSFYLNFVPNEAHRIDIVCSNTAKTIATVSPGQGNWALISVLASVRRASLTQDYKARWMAFDPYKRLYKGPRTYAEPSQFPMLSCGISVFVNTASASSAYFLPADAIAPGWGGDDDEKNGMLNTNELSWEVGARNGGTMFIDNVYWECGDHSLEYEGADREQAARMLEFDQGTSEPTPHTMAEQWLYYR